MQDPVSLPIDKPEIDSGRNCADLVPDPVRNERRFRIVEHDRFLLVEPARVLIHLRSDRLDTEREDLVAELALFRVEDLPLPDQEVDQLLGRPLELAARSHQDGPVALATRDLAAATALEERVKLVLRHLKQLWNVDGHCAPQTAVRNRSMKNLSLLHATIKPAPAN